MDETIKRYDEIIKLMKQLLGRDDFKEWLKDGENIDIKLYEYDSLYTYDLFSPHGGDFNRSLERTCNFLAMEIREVAYHQKKMWATYDNFMKMCESYAKDEKEIKQPDLLKFIAGYKEWKNETKK